MSRQYQLADQLRIKTNVLFGQTVTEFELIVNGALAQNKTVTVDVACTIQLS